MGNLDRTVKNAVTFEAKVREVKIHGRFNLQTYANNLALLDVNSSSFLILQFSQLTSQ